MVCATASATYHAFLHKLEPAVRLLLDSVHINKHANGGGIVTWDDVVVICHDSLAGVSIAGVGPAPIASSTGSSAGVSGA